MISNTDYPEVNNKFVKWKKESEINTRDCHYSLFSKGSFEEWTLKK